MFPALSVARALRDQGARITWLGTRRGIESRVVPDKGFDIEYTRPCVACFLTATETANFASFQANEERGVEVNKLLMLRDNNDDIARPTESYQH